VTAMAARHVYLDWNATAPPCAEALAAMRAAFEIGFANPASVHGPGRRARAFVEEAREAVAALVGLDARDVLLTSGGTEANNLALALPFGAGDAAPPGATDAGRRAATDTGRPAAMIVSRLEHPSIVRAAEELERRGVRVAWIEPAASGEALPEAFAEAIERLRAEADVRLLVLQAVNHETGVLQPVADVARIARAAGALLHVDAVQAVGRLPAEAWAGADMVSVAAHKIRGPKGVGALCTRPGLKVRPLLFGGAQERGLRPGTQDPVACAGFAAAARRALDGGPARYAEVRPLRDRLEFDLVALGALVNGTSRRAPHVANLSWPGWRGDELCAALDLEGVAVSSGSACSAGTAEPSPVLRAMLGLERASSAVRLSLGDATTAADVDRALAAFRAVVARR
jgi:cysteine desulfurase